MRCVLLIVFVACAADKVPTYHEDVAPIINGRCIGCHSDGGIAPFALTNYAEAEGMAPLVREAVAARAMPPWHAGAADVSYRNDISLSDEHIETIVDWVDGGTPEGSATKANPPMAAVAWGIDRVDLDLTWETPYVPQTAPDDYRCFPMPWSPTANVYITGFNVVPGNSAIVHHVAAFVIASDAPQNWDAEDEAPGYSCFGEPTGGRAADVPLQMLGGWVPGNDGATFPDGIGILVTPGSTVILQVHYNAVTAEPAGDRTTLQLQLEDSVTRRAIYAPFLSLAWFLGAMPIPAGDGAVVHEYVDDPRWFLKLQANDVDLSNGFDLYAMLFHMHQRGASGEVMLLRADGTRRVLLNIPRWDFDWQRDYYLSAPVRFEPGDKLALRCVFDNADGEASNWGEGTGSEMCVVNLLLAP